MFSAQLSQAVRLSFAPACSSSAFSFPEHPPTTCTLLFNLQITFELELKILPFLSLQSDCVCVFLTYYICASEAT